MSHLEQFKTILDTAGRDYQEYLWEGQETVIEPSQPLRSARVRVYFNSDGSFMDLVPYAR